MNRLRFGVGVLALLLLGTQAGWGQSNVATGLLLGSAGDASGAALPGVAVEVKNVDTGLTRRAVTDPNGVYRVDLLPSGTYDVKATLSGYNTEVKKGVAITLGSRVQIDYIMNLAAVSEEIVVTAEAPVVETTNPNVSASVGEMAIANLPLYGRDFQDFVALTPYAVAGEMTEVAGGRGGLNIGARAIQNSYNIDGSNSQSSFFGEERGGIRPPFTFSQAAIKEFQVSKSSYNAQFNSSGGVVNAITKSGTNELHGELFGYYSDESFVNDNALGEVATDFDRKQYGLAIGGPFVKDEVHYFASFDAQDYETPVFREFFDFPADRVAEWEALTGLDYATEVGAVPQTNDAQVIMVKVDWQLTDSNLLVLRDNWSDQEGENLTDNFRTNGRSTNGFEENSFNSFVANVNSLVSEDAFNEVILQYSLEERPRTANVTSIPEVQIRSFRAVFGQNNFLPNWLDEERFQILDNFTYYSGEHTFKAGFNLEQVEFDDGFCRYCAGSYVYNDWETFLDGGTPRSYQQAFSESGGQVVFNNDYYTAYFQDELRLGGTFTLTAGLRYDYQDHSQPKETNLLYPDTGKIPDDNNNFAPRLGFAWDIAGDGKQVLRGGVGYFYDISPSLLDANAMLTNGIRVVRVSVSNCATAGTCPTFPDTWESLGSLATARPDLFVYDPEFENPETLRMSLGYERELIADFSVGVDLIYSETDHLQRKLDHNLVLDGGTTIDGRPSFDYNAVYSGLGKIMVFTSDAEGEYKAAILHARKRFSNSWMIDGSYTWSEAEDQDSNERSVSSSGDFAENQFDLDNEWGPSNFDVEHKFVLSGTYQLPWGFQVSAIALVRSGFPYTATDGRDLNGDGYFSDRATVETSPGVYYHYPRNTFRQPWYRNLDLRLAKAFSFGEDMELELIAEVFNVLDAENWRTINFQLVDSNGAVRSNFGEKNDPGNPRTYQAGLKFRF